MWTYIFVCDEYLFEHTYLKIEIHDGKIGKLDMQNIQIDTDKLRYIQNEENDVYNTKITNKINILMDEIKK